MDDTKKALLSIDIDTSALITNLGNAKSAVSDLITQLNNLKSISSDSASGFNTMNGQLKTNTTDLSKATKAVKDYTDALTQKNQADADAAKAAAAAAKAKTDTKPDPKTDTKTDTKTPDQSASGASTTTAASSNESFFKKELSNVTNFVGQKLKIVQDGLKKEDNVVSTFLQKHIIDQKTNIDADIKLAQTRDDAYLKSATTISNLLGKQTIAGKIALDAKKAFTIAEIGINTAQAVSAYVTATANAVSQDMSVPVAGPVLAAADIAWGAVEIAGAIASGVQQVEKVNAVQIPSPSTTSTFASPSSSSSSSSTPTGKARGGVFISDGYGAYLTGPGNSTSDSINARLSNGESIINARSTQMFAPILSAINQAGGGVAFHTGNTDGAFATGGLFNGSNTFNDASNDLATTRATNNMIKTITANMPRQVLVVEDVQASLQNKVMLQNMSNF